MRLHPSVTEPQAYEWLRDQAAKLVDDAQLAAADDELRSLALAMAAISQTVLPDDLEPRFP